MFIIFGTAFEFTRNQVQTNENQSKFLIAFSLRQNWNRLLKSTDPKSIDCINGLKILATFWIVVGHRSGFLDQMFVENMKHSFAEDCFFRLISFYLVAVDTFMVISGYVLAMSCMNALQK
jgi:hypothetical protein